MPRPLKLGILDDCTIILSKDIHKNASKYFFMDLPIRGRCLKFVIHKWPLYDQFQLKADAFIEGKNRQSRSQIFFSLKVKKQ